MAQTILLVGAFDTKGPEYAFVREQILADGLEVLALNTGVLGSTDLFPVDIEADRVAAAGGRDLGQLRENKDRGESMRAMAEGVAELVAQLHAEGQFEGVLGLGGSGGSSVVTAAMRALPIGVPKVCVSTVASGQTSAFVGSKDVVLFPSITDVAGVNRISQVIFSRAAGAICGMVRAKLPESVDERPIIVASMFGNTTECVDACRGMLDQKGYEVLVFHATGTGGQTMEALVDEGLVDAVLDITTTEWADEVCGGTLSAGPDRLSAPGRQGVPHLIVPGCVDMANFGPIETVPEKYQSGRNLYEWNPAITLMRTTVEENAQMGKIFAEKANAAQGPVAFLLPLRGVSILDGEGERFCDREADAALFSALKEHLKPTIRVEECDANINDAAFSERAVELMLELISTGKAN
ncbi:MAG: Tm-1-like ATP-binding domain-containing protein [Planctomycetota bacterium]|nr:Tm-1-like ATP-binding domain-containing protein [Planctomycetota bacterium]